MCTISCHNIHTENKFPEKPTTTSEIPFRLQTSRAMYETDLSILYRLKLNMKQISVMDWSQGAEIDPNLIVDECPGCVAVSRKMFLSINVKSNRSSDCKRTEAFFLSGPDQ